MNILSTGSDCQLCSFSTRTYLVCALCYVLEIFWGEKEAAVCRQSSVLHCETTPIGWCLSTHTSLEYYGMAHSVSMETAT